MTLSVTARSSRPFVIRRKRAGRWMATLSIFASTLLSLAPARGRGQTLQQEQLEQMGLAQSSAAGDWNILAGAGAVVGPAYEGATADRVRAAPLFLIDYRNELVLGPLGLAWQAIDVNGFRAGPVVGFQGGRSQSIDARLDGLGNIRTSVVAGLFANYRLGPFQLGTTVRQSVTHSDNGLLALVQFDYRTFLVPRRLRLIVGPEMEFANSQYERTWFGVSSIQSVDSGLPVFTPGGGVKDVGVHAVLTYVCTEHVLVRMLANVKELSGDLADSPIVERRTEAVVGIAAAYHFK